MLGHLSYKHWKRLKKTPRHSGNKRWNQGSILSLCSPVAVCFVFNRSISPKPAHTELWKVHTLIGRSRPCSISYASVVFLGAGLILSNWSSIELKSVCFFQIKVILTAVYFQNLTECLKHNRCSVNLISEKKVIPSNVSEPHRASQPSCWIVHRRALLAVSLLPPFGPPTLFSWR